MPRHTKEDKLIELPIKQVKQINLCGCGLAALEMVLRYRGAHVSQFDFLRSDRRLRKRVEREDSSGLSEAAIGVLALERGFKVSLYGKKLRVSKTFLKLGGKVIRKEMSKQLLLELLKDGIPPIVKVPNAGEAYGKEEGRIPHYVVVKGTHHDGSFDVADPWYEKEISREYWDRWSSNVVAVEGRIR